MEYVEVIFLKDYGSYSEFEVAKIPREEAEKLVKEGIAEIYKPEKKILWREGGYRVRLSKPLVTK